jgi:hypothetical protein
MAAPLDWDEGVPEESTPSARGDDNRGMADGTKMVFLGFGKYVRSDRIYALEPLAGGERGGGQRTRVWVEGIPEPIVASRTERSIMREMGQDAVQSSRLLDDALAFAERVAEDTDRGRVDLGDLGRRARRLLEQTAREPEPEQLF